MTTDVRVKCNGENYRAVVTRDENDPQYVYMKDGEKLFNVPQGSVIHVGEEYSDNMWADIQPPKDGPEIAGKTTAAPAAPATPPKT